MLRGNLSLLKSGASAAVLSFALIGMAEAGALPGHGHFTDGRGSIGRNANGRLSIDQNSQTGIIDWRSFSVGKANGVIFHNGSGATLNIVEGGNLSRIAGDLHATGSIYLINRAGVVVTGNGRVDTQGSFVASGRNTGEDAFTSDNKRLFPSGRAKGNVMVRGQIASANGTVGLYGRNVSASGAIAARNAVLIANDRVRVTGQLAAASRVETSGNRLALSGATISARDWLIDPKNLTVKAGAASTIETSLDAGTSVKLKTTATNTSGPGTVSTGPGDITIAAPIAWTGTATLTLDAYHSVIVNDAVHAEGKGALAIKTNDGGTSGNLLFGKTGNVTFKNLAATLKINGASYKLVSSIDTLASGIAAQPADNFALAKNFKSKEIYSAAPIPTILTGTFEGLGNTVSHLKIFDVNDDTVGLFKEIGLSGVLRDLNLSANVVGLSNGLVGGLVANNLGTIFSASVSGKVVAARSVVGGLVGFNDGGIIENSHAAVYVNAGDGGADAGGLVGTSVGQISNSYATGEVRAGSLATLGGLVGDNESVIVKSYATGFVSSDDGDEAGGLVGVSLNGTIKSSHAMGEVDAGRGGSGGGLVGTGTNGSISGSYATGNVFGAANTAVGGLVGNGGVAIKASSASGTVTGGVQSHVGGLVGDNLLSGTITRSHATGSVTGDASSYVGGLVGYNRTAITKAYATGDVDGRSGATAGGLVGENASGSSIDKSFATGDVTGESSSLVGGLAGSNDAVIENSYAEGAVTASASKAGGLLGYNETSGTVANAYSTGMVTADSVVGGLVGYDAATATNHFVDTYWDGTTSGVTSASQGAGNIANDPGITMKSNSQLKSGLPAGFASSIWSETAGINGGLPYLIGNPPP